jgi:hypothetical protein
VDYESTESAVKYFQEPDRIVIAILDVRQRIPIKQSKQYTSWEEGKLENPFQRSSKLGGGLTVPTVPNTNKANVNQHRKSGRRRISAFRI